jgi:hypothetical protein
VVEAASSIGGRMSGRSGGVGYAVRTAVNAGSELLIFVPRAPHSHDPKPEACADAAALPCRGLEVERCDDRGMVGLGNTFGRWRMRRTRLQDVVVDF